MDRQILITGAVGPKADTRALAWLAQHVTDARPDEIVCTEGSADLLNTLRHVYGGPIGIHTGSLGDHTDIDTLPELYEIAPGWVSTHGHRGGITTGAKIAGNAAMGAARRFGKSVVMGHTHRLGVITETKGYASKITSQLTGFEVGNLIATRWSARGGTRGFGMLAVTDRHVQPVAVQYAKPAADSQ